MTYTRQDLNGEWAKWLCYCGSFTEKVRAFSTSTSPLTIQIIKEGVGLAKDGIDAFFDCRYFFFREILIYLGNRKLMFARSVMPKTASWQYKKKFRGLGSRPLGEMLFARQGLIRKELKIAKISSDYPEFGLIANNENNHTSFIWARQSIFTKEKNILLLTEYFSPLFIRYLYEK